jgi:hypothetical protein
VLRCFWASYRLPPRRIELAYFRAQNSADIFHTKMGSRAVPLGKFHLHVPPKQLTLCKKSKIGNRDGYCVLKDSGPPALLALLYPPHGFTVPPVPDLGHLPSQIPPQDRSSFLPGTRCTQKLSRCLPSFPHNHPFSWWVHAVYICLSVWSGVPRS